MSFLLKIMSAENMADDDSRKMYQLLSGIDDLVFDRNAEGQAYAYISFDGPLDPGVSHMSPKDATVKLLSGNAYVMNESGKTISSFGIATPPGWYAPSKRKR